jgi:hypothetical protein
MGSTQQLNRSHRLCWLKKLDDRRAIVSQLWVSPRDTQDEKMPLRSPTDGNGVFLTLLALLLLLLVARLPHECEAQCTAGALVDSLATSASQPALPVSNLNVKLKVLGSSVTVTSVDLYMIPAGVGTSSTPLSTSPTSPHTRVSVQRPLSPPNPARVVAPLWIDDLRPQVTRRPEPRSTSTTKAALCRCRLRAPPGLASPVANSSTRLAVWCWTLASTGSCSPRQVTRSPGGPGRIGAERTTSTRSASPPPPTRTSCPRW